MGIEYIARIAERDYDSFRSSMSTSLPADYEMWRRVRGAGKVQGVQRKRYNLR